MWYQLFVHTVVWASLPESGLASLCLLARSLWHYPWYPFPHVLRVHPVPSTNPIVKTFRVPSPAPSLLRAKTLYVHREMEKSQETKEGGTRNKKKMKQKSNKLPLPEPEMHAWDCLDVKGPLLAWAVHNDREYLSTVTGKTSSTAADDDSGALFA
jgi:hypothetical protein